MKQVISFLNSKYTIYIIPILYLLIVFFNIKNIGIGWDTPVNLNKGEQVFNFLTTLNKKYLLDSTYTNISFRFFSEVPALENGHPPAFSFISYSVGFLFSSIFGFKYYFFHLANIALTAVGLVYIAKIIIVWSKKVDNIFIVFSQVILISIPQFFIYTVTSTKDVPVIFLTLISIYYLSTVNTKNLKKNVFLFTFLFTLALFSKFTAIFTAPLVMYLVYIKREQLINLKTALFVVSVFLGSLIIFWPHLVFNFGSELQKLNFVYIQLPTSSVSEEPFTYYYLRQLPIVHTVIFLFAISMLPFIKNRAKLFLWVAPALIYLILVNRYYQVFRQFLFVFPPLVITLYFCFDYLKQKSVFFKKYSYILAFPVFLYLIFLLFLPPHKKVFYSSFIADKSTKDVWGVSLPVALNYVYKTYQPSNIYYSPLSFLMEYQQVSNKGFVITYVPQNSYIWIANPQVNAYSEEKEVRENFYTKDTNFVDGEQSLEVWVRK